MIVIASAAEAIYIKRDCHVAEFIPSITEGLLAMTKIIIFRNSKKHVKNFKKIRKCNCFANKKVFADGYGGREKRNQSF